MGGGPRLRRCHPLSGVVLAVFIFTLQLSTSVVDGQEWETENTIGAVSGQVHVRLAPEQQWQIAQVGHRLEPGEEVRTGEESSVEIHRGEEGILELTPHSDVAAPSTPSTFYGEPSRTIFLRKGTLLGRVKPNPSTGSTLHIRTPTAVAAVRGTEFGVSLASERETSAGVFDEGHLEVESLDAQGNLSGAKVDLNPGEETTARWGMPPTRPRPLAVLARYRARMEVLRHRIHMLHKQRRSLPSQKRRELRQRLRKPIRP